MKSQIRHAFAKLILFSICSCFGLYATGQTPSSAFKKYIHEKQQSTSTQIEVSTNLHKLESDPIIREMIVPEWNFKEQLYKYDTFQTPIPIEIKRSASNSVIYEPQIDEELLKIRLIQNKTEMPVYVKIYNMNGTVFYDTIIQTDIGIDISSYPPGIYILYTSSSATTHQFLKFFIK